MDLKNEINRALVPKKQHLTPTLSQGEGASPLGGDGREVTDFETYWTLFRPDTQFENRRDAAEQEWNKHPDKHEAIIAWLRKHGAYKGRNPYFFIQDFQVKQPRQQVLSYAAYYERFRTTEEQGGWVRKFLPEKQTTIYVKN